MVAAQTKYADPAKDDLEGPDTGIKCGAQLFGKCVPYTDKSCSQEMVDSRGNKPTEQ